MSRFIIFRKFSLVDAVENMAAIEKWFREHKGRKVCKTDLGFTVRRNCVVLDILKHTIDFKEPALLDKPKGDGK